MAAELGIVKKSGSWFSMDGTQLGQGAEKTRQKLIQDPAMTDSIETRVKEKMK
jgi:recombination protein RecA